MEYQEAEDQIAICRQERGNKQVDKDAGKGTDKKFTLCIDEVPNLIKQSPELPSVLKKSIDEKKLKFSLIICGSSQALMYGLILNSSRPVLEGTGHPYRGMPNHLPKGNYRAEQIKRIPEAHVHDNVGCFRDFYFIHWMILIKCLLPTVPCSMRNGCGASCPESGCRHPCLFPTNPSCRIHP